MMFITAINRTSVQNKGRVRFYSYNIFHAMSPLPGCYGVVSFLLFLRKGYLIVKRRDIEEYTAWDLGIGKGACAFLWSTFLVFCAFSNFSAGFGEVCASLWGHDLPFSCGVVMKLVPYA
jgi:hypothetical protein